MKIIGFSFSPRKNGNTEIMIREALNSAKENGAKETELIRFHNLKVAPCNGCWTCRTTGKCKIKDDWQQIYDKLLEADGIILGSPVYWWDVTAQTKIFIDRSCSFGSTRILRNKIGGIIVVTGRAGNTLAFTTLATYINLTRMTLAGGAMGYAAQPGDIRDDKRGMAEAKALGRVVVRLAKRAARIDPTDQLEQEMEMPVRVPGLSIEHKDIG